MKSLNRKPISIFPRMASVIAAVFLVGCSELKDPFYGLEKPTVIDMTSQNRELRELPAPTARVKVAVYSFPDETGQFKERQQVQSVSRAVTQGGSSMLIKALQDAGERRWFSVLDRSGLEDLLRERQIVTEMRRLYRGENTVNPNALGPLAHAGIVLQGGIVGYDTNQQTGGFGARFLGIGANTEWKMDTVTVALRAVSTETGEVLASVTTQKSIASSAVQGSVFRYVEMDKLLEMETGISVNEGKYIAVQQAIEKAVLALVIEGSELGVWSFANKAAGNALTAKYRNEKYAGAIPATARNVVRPDTAHPTKVVKTHPRRRSPVRQRKLVPTSGTQKSSAPPPPPPASNETLG